MRQSKHCAPFRTRSASTPNRIGKTSMTRSMCVGNKSTMPERAIDHERALHHTCCKPKITRTNCKHPMKSTHLHSTIAKGTFFRSGPFAQDMLSLACVQSNMQKNVQTHEGRNSSCPKRLLCGKGLQAWRALRASRTQCLVRVQQAWRCGTSCGCAYSTPTSSEAWGELRRSFPLQRLLLQ